jgi:hypothetical protein
VSAEGTLGQLGGSTFAPGLAAYVDIIHDVPDPSAFGLRLGIEMAKGVANDNADGLGQLNVARMVLRMDVCPVRAVASQPWSTSTIEALACGRLDAGVLQFTPDSSDSQARPWVAPGSKVAVRWVDRRFFFEFEANLTFPLFREVVVEGSGTTVYHVPWAVGGGGIGIGWFFL